MKKLMVTLLLGSSSAWATPLALQGHNYVDLKAHRSSVTFNASTGGWYCGLRLKPSTGYPTSGLATRVSNALVVTQKETTLSTVLKPAVSLDQNVLYPFTTKSMYGVEITIATRGDVTFAEAIESLLPNDDGQSKGLIVVLENCPKK